MFSCLLDGLVIHFHLLWKVFLQPSVFLYSVMDEEDGLLQFYLHGAFSFLSVIKPRLCPPSHSCTVGIDAHQPWNIKALHIDVQFSKRVDDATCLYGFVMEFFFRTSLNVDR